MILDNYLDKLIGQKILDRNTKERENHKSSGKLSASMLGQPLQWQILKIKGVPTKDIDEYALRKMLRGKQIEEWFIKEIGSQDSQNFAEYRGCIGYIDAILDTSNWFFPCSIIPCEVKSVSNAKYKRILKEKKPQESHILQACFYALAKKTEQFAIVYIAADDLRINTWIFDTKEYASKVDQCIDEFNEAMAKNEVPVFVPKEDWQANVKYSNYPEWQELTQEEINLKIKQYENKS